MTDHAQLRAVTPRRVLVATVLAGTAVRMAAGWALAPGVDEAYQFANSLAPQLSYFDHPPVSFWLIWLMVKATGGLAPPALRLPFILLTAGSTVVMFRLARALFGEWPGAWSAVIFNLAPIWGVAGGWTLPDVPLTFFMLAAAACLAGASGLVPAPRPRRLWVASGLFLGLAMLSKYHAALFLVGAILFLLTTRSCRRTSRHPAPWAGLLLALLLFAPVVLWNARHGFASFVFQGGRALPRDGIHASQVLNGVLGPALFILPWIWWPLLVEGYRAARSGPRVPERWFLLCLAAVPVGLFALTPLVGGRALAHWAGPGYLFLVPLLGAAVARDLVATRAALVRRWLLFSCLATPVLVAAVGSQAAFGAWSRIAPGRLRGRDPTAEAVGWEDFSHWARDRGFERRHDLFFATASWRDAGKAAAALGPAAARVVVLGDDPRNFAFSRDLVAVRGSDAVIFAAARAFPKTLAICRPLFDSVESPGEVVITRGGVSELTVTVAYAHGFRGPP